MRKIQKMWQSNSQRHVQETSVVHQAQSKYIVLLGEWQSEANTFILLMLIVQAGACRSRPKVKVALHKSYPKMHCSKFSKEPSKLFGRLNQVLSMTLNNLPRALQGLMQNRLDRNPGQDLARHHFLLMKAESYLQQSSSKGFLVCSFSFGFLTPTHFKSYPADPFLSLAVISFFPEVVFGQGSSESNVDFPLKNPNKPIIRPNSRLSSSLKGNESFLLLLKS